MRLERIDEQRDHVGWRRHVGVREDDQIGRCREHAGANSGALSAVGHGQHAQIGFRSCGTGGLGASADQVGRSVGAAVVDDEDLDSLRKRGGSGCSVSSALAAAPEVAEELVERRSDPLGLVEGGQDKCPASVASSLGVYWAGGDARRS